MAGGREKGLNVVHADHVARLAERISRGLAGGRYLCTCASPELRERIERALATALGGPDHLVRVDVSGGDPWNTVRLKQFDEQLPTARVVYTLHGLAEAARTAVERGAKHPYEQLNFARDGLSSSGTHLLVWLDGIEEIERFAAMAPDLWTYRSEVVAFLSERDFGIVRLTPAQTALGDRLSRIDRDLAEPGMQGLPRVRLLDDRAFCLIERRQAERALESVEEALRIVGRRHHSEPDWMQALLFLGIRHVAALRTLERFDEAYALGERYLRLARASRSTLEAAHAELVATVAWHLGWHGESIRTRSRLYHDEWQSEQGRDVVVLNLRRALIHAGRLREVAAAEADHPLRSNDASVRGAEPELTALRARETGDSLRLLAEAAAACAQDAALGGARTSVAALSLAGQTLARLGLADDADEVYARAERLEVGSLAAFELLVERMAYGSGMRSAVDADLLRRLRALAAKGSSPSERVVFAGTLLAGAEDAVGAVRDALCMLVLDVLGEGRIGPPHEERARFARFRALVALRRFRGASRLAPAVSSWARDHRGPSVQSDLRRTLSEIQLGLGDRRRALGYADAALQLAREDEDNHRIVKAHEARAGALVALGRVPDARAALDEALAVARAEGLRPVELRLLHEITELPEGADRASVAREALLLAKELMFPREEARALMNLARLGLPSGESIEQVGRWLDRAAMWTEALGPVERLDAIRELRARSHAAPQRGST